MAALSAGVVIWAATSRVRATQCAVRMDRRSATSDSWVVSEKRPPKADFQLADRSCPQRLIDRDRKDQRRNSGPDACERGAGSPVVDDRAASGKDGRVVHRAHNLDVVEMRDVGEITRATANQRSLA